MQSLFFLYFPNKIYLLIFGKYERYNKQKLKTKKFLTEDQGDTTYNEKNWYCKRKGKV